MRSLISIPLLVLLSACSDFGYYWHNANSHLELMNQRVDIETLLEDETTPPSLRERLLLVQDIRRFSVERRDLPDNGSYSSYVELRRPWVVQNLFAAPEFSTRLQQWCYPVIGCASYRGYYDESRLQAYADELRAEGLDVYVGAVSAYSTLGWFDDPVLSSFVDWPEYRLAGLLFHELTHQRIYIDDDTTFNESLASAVQQRGTELWLNSSGRHGDLAEFSRWLAYRRDVIALIVSTREQLAKVYADDQQDAAKREQKALVFEQARGEHDRIAERHDINSGFRRWFAAELNNAKIGSVSAYNSRLNAFIHMLDANDDDFAAFFRYAERLGELPREQRDVCLDAWDKGPSGIGNGCPADEGRLTAGA
jgi:predicted aminopeptidase